MNLSDRRARTWPVLGVARTATDGCRLLRTRPAALAGRWSELRAGGDGRDVPFGALAAPRDPTLECA